MRYAAFCNAKGLINRERKKFAYSAERFCWFANPRKRWEETMKSKGRKPKDNRLKMDAWMCCHNVTIGDNKLRAKPLRRDITAWLSRRCLKPWHCDNEKRRISSHVFRFIRKPFGCVYDTTYNKHPLSIQTVGNCHAAPRQRWQSCVFVPGAHRGAAWQLPTVWIIVGCSHKQKG